MLHLIVYSMVMTMHHILKLLTEVWQRIGVWLSKMPSWGKTVTGRKSQLGASGQDTVSNHKSISKSGLGSAGHKGSKCICQAVLASGQGLGFGRQGILHLEKERSRLFDRCTHRALPLMKSKDEVTIHTNLPGQSS